MQYLMYTLVLLGVVWFLSRWSAARLTLCIGDAIPYQWTTGMEIVTILENSKIQDHFWLLVIPTSVYDLHMLWLTYREGDTRFFIFVRFDLNLVMMQLEECGVVQKKVYKRLHLSDILSDSNDLMMKIRNELKDSHPYIVNEIMPSEDMINQFREDMKGSDKDHAVLMYKWRKKLHRKKKRKRKIFWQLAPSRT